MAASKCMTREFICSLEHDQRWTKSQKIPTKRNTACNLAATKTSFAE